MAAAFGQRPCPLPSSSLSLTPFIVFARWFRSSSRCRHRSLSLAVGETPPPLPLSLPRRIAAAPPPSRLAAASAVRAAAAPNRAAARH
uniref:Uncharacterized protein n=1 Tax=Oryza sativa subsp. japonica TaxID=39947 RepID=Q69LL8_ORYSJ|nr:hypothetical protein [Oryza sativa Japonica Group]